MQPKLVTARGRRRSEPRSCPYPGRHALLTRVGPRIAGAHATTPTERTRAWSSRTTGSPSVAAGGSCFSVFVATLARGRVPDLAGHPAVRLLGTDLRLDQRVRHLGGLPGRSVRHPAGGVVRRPGREPPARGTGERRARRRAGSRRADRPDRGRVVPETVILEITATDPDPAVARDIAQAYAEGLKALVADLETPSGSSNALIKASIVDNAQLSDVASPPSRCATSASPPCSGCCSGSGWPWPGELLDTSISSADDVAQVTHDADPRAHQHRPTVGAAAASRVAQGGDAMGGGVPRPAHQHAVRRGRPRPEGLRGDQRPARRGQVDHRAQPGGHDGAWPSTGWC